ncbi:hypothetical protein [Lysobacter gummosus]
MTCLPVPRGAFRWEAMIRRFGHTLNDATGEIFMTWQVMVSAARGF